MASSSAEFEKSSIDTEMCETNIDDKEEAERVAEILYAQYVNGKSVIDDLDAQEDQALLSQQPGTVPSDSEEILNTHGVEVTLPVEASESQKKLMNHIIDSILAPEQKNVLVQCRGVKGHSLELLCASLAAFKHLEDTNGSPKKIRLDTESQNQLIYACRTRDEMQAVIKQLRKTIYKDTPMTILETRDQVCLNKVANPPNPVKSRSSRSPEGQKEREERKQQKNKVLDYLRYALKDRNRLPKTLDDWCGVLRHPVTVVMKNGVREDVIERCSYFDERKLADFSKYFQRGHTAVFDIEDIVKAGEKKHVCPYYALREMKKEAKLIICTHNHLLDPSVRKTSKLNFNDKTTIIIDSVSRSKKLGQNIRPIILKGEKINDWYQTIRSIKGYHTDYDHIHRILSTVFTKFREWLLQEQNSERKKEPYQPCEDGKSNREISVQIFDVLSRLKLSEPEIGEYSEIVKNHLNRIDKHTRDVRFCGHLLDGFFNIMWLCKTLYNARAQQTFKDYTILLKRSTVEENARRQLAGIKLQVICNDLQPIFEPIKRAHTIIVASKTGDRHSFASKLGIQFHHQIRPFCEVKTKRSQVFKSPAADADTHLWEQYMAGLRDSDPKDTNEDVKDVIPPLEPPLKIEEVLNIDGVPIHFPYRPYKSQKVMMQRMIACILSAEPAHALLKSPTGMGKTAAILCGILGFFKHLEGPSLGPQEPRLANNRNFQLIYATRTKSQIHAVIEQLKLTAYKDTPTAILENGKLTFLDGLANPESTCDEPSICRRDAEDRLPSAMHVDQFSSCTDPFSTTEDRGSVMVKVEDAHELYEVPKEAKLFICTQHNLMYHHIRGASGVEISDRTILVLDDAHNLQNVCRDIVSMSLTGASILRLHSEIERVQHVDPQFLEIRNIMADVLGRLNSWIHEQERLHFNRKKHQDIFRVYTKEIFMTLERLNLSEQAIRTHYRALIHAINLGARGTTTQVRLPFSKDLVQEFSNILWTFNTLYAASTVNETGNLCCSDDFTIVLTKRKLIKGGKPKNAPDSKIKRMTLQVSCNSPAIIFEHMKAAHTIIATTGALSPSNRFASELDVKFRYIENFPPDIDRSRVFAAIIDAHSIKAETLNFDPENVKKQKVFRRHAADLASVIIQISSEVPNGILVFFPSEEMLRNFKDCWDTKGFLDDMTAVKDIFFEPSAGESYDVVKSYKQSIAAGRGALFFSLMQGRLFEGAGVDFRDAEVRAVITVGIPLISLDDHPLGAKRKIKSNIVQRPGSNDNVPGKWHRHEAFRALHQVLNRYIRHVNDWGLIFMVDSRLTTERFFKCLPSWIIPSLVENEKFTDMVGLTPDICRFVATHQAKST